MVGRSPFSATPWPYNPWRYWLSRLPSQAAPSKKISMLTAPLLTLKEVFMVWCVAFGCSGGEKKNARRETLPCTDIQSFKYNLTGGGGSVALCDWLTQRVLTQVDAESVWPCWEKQQLLLRSTAQQRLLSQAHALPGEGAATSVGEVEEVPHKRSVRLDEIIIDRPCFALD